MEPTDYEILDEMHTTGGGFVQAFAMAFRKADLENRRLMRPVFEKYRDEYAQRVVDRKARACARCP